MLEHWTVRCAKSEHHAVRIQLDLVEDHPRTGLALNAARVIIGSLIALKLRKANREKTKDWAKGPRTSPTSKSY